MLISLIDIRRSDFDWRQPAPYAGAAVLQLAVQSDEIRPGGVSIPERFRLLESYDKQARIIQPIKALSGSHFNVQI